MFKNYFKIGIRQLRKHKMYSFIKIAGFALSIAACLVIALYINNELSYDRSWANADRLYRLTGEYNNNGKIESGADWPAPMAKALREDFPEVENAGRLMPHPLFYGAGSNQVRRAGEQQNTYEDGFTYADQSMLDMLKAEMVYGDVSSALSEPNTIVLSKEKADKYFPNQNPLGKLLILNNDNSRPYKVSGVIQNFPATSHIRYHFLLTLTSHQLWNNEQQNWGASNYYTYVLLKKGSDVENLKSKLKLILTKYYIPMMKESGDKEADELLKKAKLILQPIPDVHLKSYNISDGLEKGDMRFVWLFGAIACFILVIACINFINLSTAKSANRAREVGLRKVVGSDRLGLIKQFLTESLIFSIASFILGILIAALVLPYFNTVANRSLVIPWGAWWLLPLMLVVAIAIGIVAGLYPSFYLSHFKPINVLKGQLSRGSKNSVLRNALVVFQFSTSIILIISTLVIYNQTKYILNRKVGFEKDQVLVLHGTNTLQTKLESFKNELLKSSVVKSVSASDYLPVSGTKRDGNTVHLAGKEKEDIGVSAQKWVVDHEYINTLGMRIVQGRGFSKTMSSDSAGAVINQSMAEKMNLKNPIGQNITNGWQKFTVIGVMEDFNFESMKKQVGPLCLTLSNYNSSMTSVKFAAGDINDLITHISGVWKKFSPDQPLRYTFLDESFANMYADVKRTGNIFTSFAVLAIIIACLGLFALSAFMAEQRNKEIAIRKVLGASVSGITAMLSNDFIRLVGLAILIGSPIAYWAMSKWLQDFAYRVDISWWILAAAALVAILIATITVSAQAIKAATANPVNSLRAE